MRPVIFISLGMCLFLATGCGPSGDKRSGQTDTSKNSVPDAKDAARQNAIDNLEDQTYEDVMGSDACTEDCSGHDAGWEWAKKHEIFDPDECSGNSDSFIEGCKAYGEEVERRTNDAEGGSDGDSN